MAKVHPLLRRFPTRTGSSILVQRLERVYARNSMGIKSLISILVLLLSGADSGAAWVCSASCMSSAPVVGGVADHHQIDSQPSATQVSQRGHHHGAPCAECPPQAGNRLNQKADCSRMAEIQALREGSFSFDAPTGPAQFMTNRPADRLPLGFAGQRFFLFGDFPSSRSSGPPPLPLPLRI